MPELRDKDQEGPLLEPQPDPWGPPGANALQGGGTAAAAAGVIVLESGSSTNVAPESIAMLLDPSLLFARLAHLLGFQFDASNAWTLGILLVVLGVVLNVISLAMRYRYARHIVAEQDKNRAKDAQLQASAAATRKGFISGEG